jgi:hypothetical protein
MAFFWVAIRVCLLLADCLLLGSFVKISEMAQIMGLLLSTVKVTYVFIFARNELGYILGDFFTNASGHPDGNRVALDVTKVNVAGQGASKSNPHFCATWGCRNPSHTQAS